MPTVIFQYHISLFKQVKELVKYVFYPDLRYKPGFSIGLNMPDLHFRLVLRHICKDHFPFLSSCWAGFALPHLGITSLSLGVPWWGFQQRKKTKGLCPFLYGAAAANIFACGQPQYKKKLCIAQL